VIKPTNAKGLSNEQIQELQRNLTQMAKERLGEVMIMDIGNKLKYHEKIRSSRLSIYLQLVVKNLARQQHFLK
jgi:hypothetical protein